MIELKITGDALEVKSEIENLFNMTSGYHVEAVLSTPERFQEEKETEDVIKNEHQSESVEKKDVQDDIPERDKRGFKWDERIHSTGKTTNKDGTWRNARGVSDETLEMVELELAKEAKEAGVLDTKVIPDSINPDVVEADPEIIKPVTDAEMTSAMIKFTQSLTGVKDAEGNAVIGKAVPLLMKKMSVGAVYDIKGDSQRNEFLNLCKAVGENAQEWESILGE
ncbi:putative recombinase [Proteus phage vB_PmiS_PM-CJR]|nr:putative recombinase [Proteus phage vB_PmiS_PM-CJR]